jgi:predicted methyltransferase
MEPYAVERWRRVDPVRIIKEALDAGFELEAWSDLHARAEDGLVHDSVHPAIDKYSDRFTLKFRKPVR